MCPACRPWAAAVKTRDGRRLGYKPEALYVGYLATPGLKRPPAACPNCGAALQARPAP